MAKRFSFTQGIHELTRKFPKEELHILTSQIKRAADSIVLNITEGSTGKSDAEFRRFIGYALRSAIEVVSCLCIGKKRKIIDDKDFENLYKQVKVLKVFKNETKYTPTDTIRVSYYSWEKGVPKGISTIYIEKYGSDKSNLWKLIGGKAQTGVSHARQTK